MLNRQTKVRTVNVIEREVLARVSLVLQIVNRLITNHEARRQRPHRRIQDLNPIRLCLYVRRNPKGITVDCQGGQRTLCDLSIHLIDAKEAVRNQFWALEGSSRAPHRKNPRSADRRNSNAHEALASDYCPIGGMAKYVEARRVRIVRHCGRSIDLDFQDVDGRANRYE